MISSLDSSCVNPANVNLRIGKLFRLQASQPLNVHKDERANLTELTLPYELQPNEYVVAKTIEVIAMPSQVTGLLFPVSKCLRWGLMVNAGSIEPGYEGVVHAGIFNASSFPIVLEREQEILKVVFLPVTGKGVPFSSNWQGGVLL